MDILWPIEFLKVPKTFKKKVAHGSRAAGVYYIGGARSILAWPLLQLAVVCYLRTVTAVARVGCYLRTVTAVAGVGCYLRTVTVS